MEELDPKEDKNALDTDKNQINEVMSTKSILSSDETYNKITYQTIEQDDFNNPKNPNPNNNEITETQINKKNIFILCITVIIIFFLFSFYPKSLDINLNPDKIHIKIPPYPNPNEIRIYPLDEKTDTKCLDGSQYGIYYSPGKNSGENNLVISFEGGGWCLDRDENEILTKCLQRTGSYYGSSKPWKNTYIYENNFNGGEAKKNPQFYNWNKIIIPYCDGTGNQGYRKNSSQADFMDLYFKGYKNTLEGLKFAFTHIDIDKLDKVVVSGCSSAAWAAFQWMGFIEDYLEKANPKANLMGIINAGFFFEYENIVTKDFDFTLKFKNLYNFANKEIPIVNKNCQKENNDKPYMCFFPQVLIDYVKSPILMYQAQYDSWQIWEVLGEQCVNDHQSLKFCNDKQKKDIIKLKDYTKLVLNKAIEKKKNLSVFSPACVMHCYKDDKRLNWDVQVKGYNVDKLMSEFVDTNGLKQIVLIDDVEWPNNTKCANA